MFVVSQIIEKSVSKHFDMLLIEVQFDFKEEWRMMTSALQIVLRKCNFIRENDVFEI